MWASSRPIQKLKNEFDVRIDASSWPTIEGNIVRLRSKLAIITAIPLLALFAVLAWAIVGQARTLSTASEAVETHADTVAIHMSMLTIGKERLHAVGGDVGDKAEIESMTDEALASLVERTKLGPLSVPAKQAQDLVDQARAGGETDIELLSEANDVLRLVDGDDQLGYPDASGRNAITVNRLSIHALEAQELAWLDYLGIENPDSSSVATVSAGFSKADELFAIADRLAIEARDQDLSALLDSETSRAISALEAEALNDLSSDSESLDRAEVVATNVEFRSGFVETITTLDGRLTDRLDEQVSAASRAILLLALVAALGLLALIAMVVIIARSILEPFGRLVHRADEVATVDLPKLIETLRDDDGSTDIPPPAPIAAEADDEIGELVAAFNNVQTTAHEVAIEQAVGRRNVAALFVNLGRRNQQLLQRILEQLTELEGGEEDPDKLAQLFNLDNVVTRMRRNAENIMALAGNQTSRTWPRPIPIDNAVRAAFGEVEGYERVEVDRLDHSLISGGIAADVSHLIAELLENALNFSDRTKNVVVEGQLIDDSYNVTIADAGIGMGEADLITNNLKLSDPPALEQVSTRVLGLYVVGRLATRHGITVFLSSGDNGGVVATVVLPPALLVAQPPVSPPPAVEPEAKRRVEGERSPLESQHDLDAELASITEDPELEDPEVEDPEVQDPELEDPELEDPEPAPPEEIDGLPVRARGGSLKKRGSPKAKPKTTKAEAEAEPKQAASSAGDFSSMMSSLTVGITRGTTEAKPNNNDEGTD